MKHTLRLQPESFNKIKSGSKKIELRLFDEKRQKIKVGDVIEFLKEPKKSEMIETKVVALFKYTCFKNLIYSHPIELFDEKSRNTLLKNVRNYYSEEDELKYGVLGIQVELI